MRVLLLAVCLLSCFVPQAQHPSAPEFIKIVRCPTMKVNSGEPWFVISDYLSVEPEGELLVHRSGKMIELCQGNYNIDSLSRTLAFNDTHITSRSCTVNTRCFGHMGAVSAGWVDDDPPYVLLPHNPNRLFYLPAVDTLTILTTQKNNYRIRLSDIFEDSVLFENQNDNIIRININPWKKDIGLLFSLSLDGRPGWEEESYHISELPKSKEFETSLINYDKTLESSSENFTAFAKAYFYEAHDLFIESHALFRNLYLKDRTNKFYREAYYHFTLRHRISNIWNKP